MLDSVHNLCEVHDLSFLFFFCSVSCFNNILTAFFVFVSGTQVPVVLVGNKCDLEAHRQVSVKTVEETTTQSMSGCKFFEASAKYDLNVKDVFLELLQIARNLEEAQEALLEEQDLFRRKSRRLSKRLSRKLSVFNNMAFNLKKPENPEGEKQNEEPSSPTKEMKDPNQKCIIL